MEEVMIEWEAKGYNKAMDELEQLKYELGRAQDEASRAHVKANRAQDEAKQYKNEIDRTKDEIIEMILKFARQNGKGFPPDWSSALKELSIRQLTKLSTFMIEEKPFCTIQEYIKKLKDSN